MNREHMNFHFNRMERMLKGKCKVSKLKDEVLSHHSKNMPLYSFNTLNGKLAFPVPDDLSGNDFRHYPEMVICDVIIIWSEVNESLKGISLKSLSCKWHENSELPEKDLTLTCDDKVTGLLIGGLRSPCPNATYVMNDSQDNLGMYLTMYDGIFENE